ncbi:MAG TPA: hypothetical protein VFS73_08615 [Solirubrobacterales bacterium]|nr:hypothetical protein [Solirubrobacterales bacterium]
MRAIPHPPRCEACGGAVGLWEAIVVPPDLETVTSWLHMADHRLPAGPIRHHRCPPPPSRSRPEPR